MINLEYDAAVKLAQEQIALKGEGYVYKQHRGEDGVGTCFYVHNNQPDCIVGHILHAAGVGLDVLSVQEGSGAWTLLRRLKDGGILEYDDRVSRLLASLQGEQDNGSTWGESLDWALHHEKQVV